LIALGISARHSCPRALAINSIARIGIVGTRTIRSRHETRRGRWADPDNPDYRADFRGKRDEIVSRLLGQAEGKLLQARRGRSRLPSGAANRSHEQRPQWPRMIQRKSAINVLVADARELRKGTDRAIASPNCAHR
jgi:hypothetical protein